MRASSVGSVGHHLHSVRCSLRLHWHWYWHCDCMVLFRRRGVQCAGFSWLLVLNAIALIGTIMVTDIEILFSNIGILVSSSEISNNSRIFISVIDNIRLFTSTSMISNISILVNISAQAFASYNHCRCVVGTNIIVQTRLGYVHLLRVHLVLVVVLVLVLVLRIHRQGLHHSR